MGDSNFFVFFHLKTLLTNSWFQNSPMNVFFLAENAGDGRQFSLVDVAARVDQLWHEVLQSSPRCCNSYCYADNGWSERGETHPYWLAIVEADPVIGCAPPRFVMGEQGCDVTFRASPTIDGVQLRMLSVAGIGLGETRYCCYYCQSRVLCFVSWTTICTGDYCRTCNNISASAGRCQYNFNQSLMRQYSDNSAYIYCI